MSNCVKYSVLTISRPSKWSINLYPSGFNMLNDHVYKSSLKKQTEEVLYCLITRKPEWKNEDWKQYPYRFNTFDSKDLNDVTCKVFKQWKCTITNILNFCFIKFKIFLYYPISKKSTIPILKAVKRAVSKCYSWIVGFEAYMISLIYYVCKIRKTQLASSRIFHLHIKIYLSNKIFIY